MVASRADSLSFPLPTRAVVIDVPKKVTIIRLRWLLVIVASYLLLASNAALVSLNAIHAFILFYIVTNLMLYGVDDGLFDSPFFYSPLVVFDTLFVTSSLIVSGQVDTDFYLAYFVVVILCMVWQDLRGLAIVAVLSSALYGYFLFGTAHAADPAFYLRVPFVYVISLFYGYFGWVARLQQSLKEQAEQDARETAMIQTLTESIPSSLDFGQILDTVGEKIKAVIRADRTFLFLVDSPYATRAMLYESGKARDSRPQDVDLHQYPLAHECLKKPTPVIWRGARSGPPARNPMGDKFLFPVSMAVPVRFKEETYGVIIVGFRDPEHAIGPRAIQFCQIVAFATAIGLSHAKKYDAVKQSEVCLQRALEAGMDGVVIFDKEGRVAFANGAAQDLFGGSQGKNGAPALSFYTASGAPLPEEEKPFVRVMRTGEPMPSMELVVSRLEKGPVPVSVNAAPVRDVVGVVVGVVMTLQALQVANAKQPAPKIQKLDPEKGEFLEVMLRELRTPLNTIMGYTGMIQDRLLGEITPAQEAALRKLLRSLAEALNMVRNVSEANRIGSGSRTLDARERNVADFIKALKSVTVAPPDKELVLRWECPRDLPVMRTDWETLRQIMENLIDNAMKFTESGQVTISVRYLTGRGLMELCVADTGIGIPRESLSAVFEMFWQAGSSGTKRYGGMGLGLYLVKNWVELLGGEVGVESEPGKGSTFIVRLPIRREGLAEKDAGGAAGWRLAENVPHGETVLERNLR